MKSGQKDEDKEVTNKWYFKETCCIRKEREEPEL